MRRDFEVTEALNATQSNIPHLMDRSAAEDGRIVLPVDNALLDADFVRMGKDLVIEGAGDRPVVVTDYFGSDVLPALLSETGKLLHAKTVELLAGNPAANQYAGPVEGLAPIGEVAKMAGEVKVTRPDGSELVLKEGDEVYQNDIIQTTGEGSIGITFIDGSVFTLGNDARMTLDEMVYDPASGEGSSSVTVMKGMFKFISGDIAANNPGDMVVETPVATIGIRGTTGGGNVVGPGQDNQFFLEPNADGTVGSFDVITDGGVQTMNQPYMQLGVTDITAPPPPPNFTSPDAINEMFAPVHNASPEGRYDARPDNSDGEPDGEPGSDGEPEGEGGEEMNAGEETPPEGEQPPAEGEAPPPEGEQPPAGEEPPMDGEPMEGDPMAAGEEPPMDGEMPPPEGELPPGEEMATLDGEMPPPEGEQPPAEGEMPPEGSDLMNADGAPMEGEMPPPEGEQPPMDAAGTEGANTDNLTQVEGQQDTAMAGDEMFDGNQPPAGDPNQPPAGEQPPMDGMQQPQHQQTFKDPTQDPMDQFISKGDALQNAPQNSPGGAAGDPQGGGVGAANAPQGPELPLPPAADMQPGPNNEGPNEIFQQITEQIKQGNLPADALTNPDSQQQISDLLGGSTPPPPPPLNDGNETLAGGTGDENLPPPPDGTEDPATPPPGNGGGGGTANGPTLRPSLRDDLLETIDGGVGDDVFVVNAWNDYFNPNATVSANTADILNGMTGFDILQLDDMANNNGAGEFDDQNTGHFNTSTMGIDRLDFSGVAFSTVDVSLDGGASGAFQRSDAGDQFGLMVGDKTTDVYLSNMQGGETFEIKGDNNAAVTVNAPPSSDLSIYLQGSGINLTMAGSSANHEFIVYEGNHNITATNFGDYTAKLYSGTTNNVTFGNGNSVIDVLGGTAIVTAGTGWDTYIMDYGMGHDITDTGGDNIFDMIGVTNSSIDAAAGNDIYFIEDTTNLTITDSDGWNIYEIDDDGAGNVGLNITGGDDQDVFYIHGAGNMVLDGGNDTDMGYSYNEYEFMDFTGSAQVQAYSGDGANYVGDVLEFHNFGGWVQLNVDQSNGTSETVYLEMYESFSDLNITYENSDNDVQINNGVGDILLRNYFTGEHAYSLSTFHHDYFSQVKNIGDRYERDLTSDEYLYAQGFIDLSGSYTAGDQIIVGGTTFTFHVGATGGFDLDIGDGIGALKTHIIATLGGAGEVDASDGGGQLILLKSTVAGFNGQVGIGVVGGAATVNSSGLLDYRGFDEMGDVDSPITSSFNALDFVNFGSGADDAIVLNNDSLGQKVYGYDGHDVLTATDAQDILIGGDGHDRFVIENQGDISAATVEGGDGFDMIDYSLYDQANSGVSVTIDAFAAGASGTGVSQIGTVEGVIGTQYDDTLTAISNFGHYWFEGGEGNDLITGGTNNVSTASYENTGGGGVAITLTGGDYGTGSEDFGGDAGFDQLTDIKNLVGSQQADTLADASADNNVFYGLDGNDILNGGGGDDILIGEHGNDTITGGIGEDVMDGGHGDDTIYMGTGAGDDSQRDILRYHHDSEAIGYTDTIREFRLEAPGNTPIAGEDAIDLSGLTHQPDVYDMNFFELKRDGYLDITDNGADADVWFKMGGSMHHIATVEGVDHTHLNWRHFITSEVEGVYGIGGSGNPTEDDYDILIATAPGSINGYDGNDIIEIAGATSGNFYADGGNDVMVVHYGGDLDQTMVIDGGDGSDRLVLDIYSGTVDFSGFDSDFVSGFEVLDLYGTDVSGIKAEDVWDITGTDISLVIEDTSGLGTGQFDVFTPGDWQFLGNTEALDLPQTDFYEGDLSNYSTYVADVAGDEVYIHVENALATASNLPA